MPWEADSQLIRGRSRGYNLAIGDPAFLREVFAPYYPRHYNMDLGYPDVKPEHDLLRQLQQLHPDQEIVVTCGAKQALYAGVFALKGDFDRRLIHEAPYWPTYPTIAAASELDFAGKEPDLPFRCGGNIICVTSPGNPDGVERVGHCDIWDAAYAASVYGWSGLIPGHTISVWSAGKLLGSPGARVGWLCTPYPEVAARARQYVEQTTSGVATTSQHHVASTLRNTEYVRDQLYAQARKMLWENSMEFLRLKPWIETVKGFPGHYGKGMFAFFKVHDPQRFEQALIKSEVALVKGSACGIEEPGWYRMSLGNLVGYHRSAIDALESALKEVCP